MRVQAGLGQDFLRSSTSNGEADRERHLFWSSGPPLAKARHLFLSSGPPVAKAWDENLGVEVGGLGYGGAHLGPILGRMWVDLNLEGPLSANMECKTLALTSSSYKNHLRVPDFLVFLLEVRWPDF